MPDEIDRAAELAAHFNDQAVAEARSRVPDGSRWGPKYCPECQEPIPDGRRRLGYQRCLECAE